MNKIIFPKFGIDIQNRQIIVPAKLIELLYKEEFPDKETKDIGNWFEPKAKENNWTYIKWFVDIEGGWGCVLSAEPYADFIEIQLVPAEA